MIGNANTTQSFRDTLRYVARETSQRIFSNIGSGITGDVDEIAKEMEREAQWSDRVEKPCYHFSLSPAPEDELTDSDWRNLTEDFLKEMELEDRQAVGWLHHDEEFPDGSPRTHLHLVVNRVDALAGAASTSWNYRHVDEVVRGLEENYQLSSVDPAQEVEVRNDSWGQLERIERQQSEYKNPGHPRDEPPEPSIKTQIQAALDEAIAQTDSTQNIPDHLEQQGIETRQSKRGWSFGKDGIHFSGSQLGKRYSRPAVERTMSQKESLSMREVMQATSEANEDVARKTEAEQLEDEVEQLEDEDEVEAAKKRKRNREQKQQAHQMRRSGQRLMEKTGDVDGLTIAGAGMSLAGTLAEHFNERIEEARSSDPNEQQQGQIQDLERIGDRTDALENQLFSEAQEAETVDAEIVDESNATSPIESSIAIADERVQRIEQEVEIEPTSEELGQGDDAIAQLDQRIEQAEVATQSQSLPEVTTLGSQVLDQEREAKTAESLENFTLARTEFKGQIQPQPYSSSIGTVELTREGFQDQDSRLSVTDENFGTVFEARKDGQSEEWTTEINELSQEEMDTVSKLPQSGQEYEQYKRGQSLVKTLQEMPQTSQQFKGDRGEIEWTGEDEDGQPFSYELGITKEDDGLQRVVGKDTESGDRVFSATIDPQEDQVFVEQNAIPESHSQQILDQRDRSRESTQSQERERPQERKELILERSKQRGLEL